jgi:hypothetical protein
VNSKEGRTVWHPLSLEALCAGSPRIPASALTDEEVWRRLLAHGPNELPAAAPISRSRCFSGSLPA